ncbi:MAG: hypothetical protein H6832_09215 [Planctomycetes bacterium]|nr:hypothetical protein [Planctomycetota bacterium]
MLKRFVAVATLGAALAFCPTAAAQLSGSPLTQDQAAAVDRAIALLESSVSQLQSEEEKERIKKAIEALKAARGGKKTTGTSRIRSDPTIKRRGMDAKTTGERVEGGKTISTPGVCEGDEVIVVDPGGMLPPPGNKSGDGKLAGNLAHEGERLRQDSAWPNDADDWTQADKCKAMRLTIVALTTNKIACKAIAAKFTVDEEWEHANWMFKRAMRIESEIRKLKDQIKKDCN